MHEYILTIGLFDKDTETQEISTASSESIISETLINGYGIYAYTLIHCHGCYRMNSTGRIVSEPSIRTDNIKSAIADLKILLNQESIMYKHCVSDIDFL